MNNNEQPFSIVLESNHRLIQQILEWHNRIQQLERENCELRKQLEKFVSAEYNK
jgi:cell shape-determining protein MreC